MDSSIYGKKIGQIFREYRLKANMSQGYVSEKLNYTRPQFISNFERGLCMLPLPKLKKVLDLYGVSGEEIVEIMIDIQREHLEQTLLKKKGKKKA